MNKDIQTTQFIMQILHEWKELVAGDGDAVTVVNRIIGPVKAANDYFVQKEAEHVEKA